MSFVSMTTRIAVSVLALALLAGRAIAAAGEDPDRVMVAPKGLSPAELGFSDALAHYCRGLVAEGTDSDQSTAVAQLEEAFRLDPGQLDITFRLAAHYQFAKNTNDLLRILQVSSVRNPDAIAIGFYLAGVYQVRMEYDKAIAEYNRLITSYPQNAAGYFGKVQTYLAKKDEKTAFKVLGEGLGVVTNSESLVAMCNQFGMAYLGAGRWDDAIASFKILRTKKPDDLGGFLNLLEAYLRKGDKASAAAHLRATPAKYRDNPRFYSVVAKHFLLTANYKEALEYFDKVEGDLGPWKVGDNLRDSAYYHLYGMACERAGFADRAEKQFELSVELDEKNVESLNYLAYMWAERAVKLDKALDYVTRALKASPANPAYLDTLGWIYFKQGKSDSALEQIEKAHALMPDEAVISEHLGDILGARKEMDRAIATWKKSFMMDPESEGVAKKLRENGVDVEQLRKEARAAKKIREKAAESE